MLPQKGKVHNVWQPVKYYQDFQEVGKYDPQWGEKLTNQKQPRTDTNVRIIKKEH